MARDRFERGSGCYACLDCGKRTRSTGDEGGTRLCKDCFDKAGLENAHADGYHDAAPCADCPACKAEGRVK